jgi:hypothetical protein
VKMSEINDSALTGTDPRGLAAPATPPRNPSFMYVQHRKRSVQPGISVYNSLGTVRPRYAAYITVPVHALPGRPMTCAKYIPLEKRLV